MDNRRSRSVLAGAVGGAIATFVMSGAMALAKKAGLMGEHPPMKIVRGMRRRIGLFGVPRKADALATIAAHWGFGIAAGTLFGLLHRPSWGLARSSLVGAAYGATVWATSYYGWVPATGLMRMPHRDRAFRAETMAAAHLLFGSVLGAFVDRAERVRATPSDEPGVTT